MKINIYVLWHLLCVVLQQINALNIDKYAYANHYENVNFICFNDWTTVCIRHFVFPLDSSKGGVA